MDQDDIALRPFVSKMLCYYRTVVRETFACKSDEREVSNVYFFVRTDTGQPLRTKDVTRAVQDAIADGYCKVVFICDSP